MDSQYKVLSELLSDQAVFITSPKTSLVNYWGGGIAPLPPPVSTGLDFLLKDCSVVLINCLNSLSHASQATRPYFFDLLICFYIFHYLHHFGLPFSGVSHF